METTHEPAPRHESGAKRPATAPPRPESSRASRDEGRGRVAVLDDRHDDEEKEAGYGHGV
jgi:hypothetical protein